MMFKSPTSPLVSLAVVSALALTACADAENGAEAPDQEPAGADAGPPEDSGEDDAAEDADESGAGEDEVAEPSDRPTQEAGGPQPRLAVTYDGGVALIDGATLDVLGDFDAEGFVRVNAAGDGRHFFLTEGESFRLIDGGTWGEPHGDHNHYYATDPLLTDITVDGETPGHVVAHDGIGTLFFDGTGEIHSFDLAELDAETEIETEVAETEHAHHGVAVAFEDGSRFETLGDDQDRPGARYLDAEGEEVARNEECPGVHGEAAGPDGMIAVGCEDGVLIWDGTEFTKIGAGEDFARIGNLFPAEDSAIFLGDYRTDEDDPMTEVSLVDAETQEITTTDVGAPYNFRNLARGPEGEAVVLTEDGRLHIIDASTGEHLETIEVLDEWTEPQEWQEPRPAVVVIDQIAYVTDPQHQEIHMIDLAAGEIINTAEFDFVPNEVAATDGRPVGGVSEDYDGDHDHEDEDHDH